MQIEKDRVVEFHYTLKDTDGEELLDSRDRDPMAYLHGASNIIPGLEEALAGKAAGDRFEVTVPPERAYGERADGRIQRIPLKRLGKGARPRPGQVLTLQTQDGPIQVTVLKTGRFNVDVDANHPLAGRTLVFDVEVMSVREATAEEREHGHAHGPGGHAHD